MLELRDITKKYAIGAFRQTALDGVTLNFRRHEFVAILGPSGSGKTTLLNMIGGLDRYDAGDIRIDGKSTRDFKDRDWDRYRNHAVGFVFQNYNLISHVSVLANVEIGLTLSGMSPNEKRQRSLELLERVGLSDHVHKKPNQLSGGQMQRVAIARALANDPDIILADEPTGAIDSETSHQILRLIQEIAKDKLVIMVTHDDAMASTYASRVVDLKDGRIAHDSDPYDLQEERRGRLSYKRTAMAFWQALKLSFSNLRTKKFRTAITAFAGSIGIVGVGLVLSLANGLNREIDRLEQTTLSTFPLQIDRLAFNIDVIRAQGGGPPRRLEGETYERRPDNEEIYPYALPPFEAEHLNDLSSEYLTYLQGLDQGLYHEMTIRYAVDMHLYHTLPSGVDTRLSTGGVNFAPTLSDPDFFFDNYDLLGGRAPDGIDELVLVVDAYNRLDSAIINAFGLSAEVDAYGFDAFLGKTFELIMLDDRFLYDDDSGRFVPITDVDTLMQQPDNITLTIVGIARSSEDAVADLLSTGLKHHPELTNTVIEHAKQSEIGAAQQAASVDVVSGIPIDDSIKRNQLQRWGVDPVPRQILIYPVDFEAKRAITDYLDAYNEDKEDADRVLYTDLAAIVTNLTSDVIDGVSYVLIAFSSISLVVSSVMIGIITYVSVLERTKEIGILRSLGARKRDISRVFNAETALIGFFAGVSGVAVAYALTFPINALIDRLVDDINRMAVMPLPAVFALVAISVLLTTIAGLIPSRIAARKDPVAALRVD